MGQKPNARKKQPKHGGKKSVGLRRYDDKSTEAELTQAVWVQAKGAL
jgi:hypothetical protein